MNHGMKHHFMIQISLCLILLCMNAHGLDFTATTGTYQEGYGKSKKYAVALTDKQLGDINTILEKSNPYEVRPDPNKMRKPANRVLVLKNKEGRELTLSIDLWVKDSEVRCLNFTMPEKGKKDMTLLILALEKEQRKLKPKSLQDF